jgi:hypothetical protein
MTNSLERAKFWQEFILSKCQFPRPEKLRSQFESAEFSEFCDCGCNSFKVAVEKEKNVEPLAACGQYGAVFEANFQFLGEEKTLEIVLLADEDGNLAYVEIDCCANSFPVPDKIEVKEPPYHVHASDALSL